VIFAIFKLKYLRDSAWSSSSLFLYQKIWKSYFPHGVATGYKRQRSSNHCFKGNCPSHLPDTWLRNRHFCIKLLRFGGLLVTVPKPKWAWLAEIRSTNQIRELGLCCHKITSIIESRYNNTDKELEPEQSCTKTSSPDCRTSQQLAWLPPCNWAAQIWQMWTGDGTE
jgi:hypothetical protein